MNKPEKPLPKLKRKREDGTAQEQHHLMGMARKHQRETAASHLLNKLKRRHPNLKTTASHMPTTLLNRPQRRWKASEFWTHESLMKVPKQTRNGPKQRSSSVKMARTQSTSKARKRKPSVNVSARRRTYLMLTSAGMRILLGVGVMAEDVAGGIVEAEGDVAEVRDSVAVVGMASEEVVEDAAAAAMEVPRSTSLLMKTSPASGLSRLARTWEERVLKDNQQP
jgi:hypothetical protein